MPNSVKLWENKNGRADKVIKIQNRTEKKLDAELVERIIDKLDIAKLGYKKTGDRIRGLRNDGELMNSITEGEGRT